MNGNNNRTTLKMVIGVLFITELAACGGLKVGADEETLAAAKCIADPSTCSDTSTENSSGSDSDSSTSSSSDSTESDGGEDASDSTGGIEELPPSARGGDSYFMGTYQIQNNGNSYGDCNYDWGNNYDFPSTIRAYSYNDNIDFENSYGDLVWVADVFPDDTFDFIVQFLDGFGRPSNTVACTCYLQDNSYYYGSEETMKCTCDPTSENDETCSLTYDLM